MDMNFVAEKKSAKLPKIASKAKFQGAKACAASN